jgi:hypothetical protein
VGFESIRRLPSIVNPGEYTMYHSKIVEGKGAPEFWVWPEDAPHVRLLLDRL